VAQIEVQQTDITKLEVDAIASAANTQLQHGGGVGGPGERREPGGGDSTTRRT